MFATSCMSLRGTFRCSSRLLPTLSSTHKFSPCALSLGHSPVRALSDVVNVSFADSAGGVLEVKAKVGTNILDLAHDNDVELEGACEGTVACSTCHVVLEKKYFDMLPAADEEEMDMLDMAFGLTDTSRLGCQVCITPELEGMKITVPDEVNDLR